MPAPAQSACSDSCVTRGAHWRDDTPPPEIHPQRQFSARREFERDQNGGRGDESDALKLRFDRDSVDIVQPLDLTCKRSLCGIWIGRPFALHPLKRRADIVETTPKLTL